LDALHHRLAGDLDPDETDLERDVRLEGERVATGDVAVPPFAATTIDGRELTAECVVMTEDELAGLLRQTASS
jgi:hypothetical protein